MHFFIHIPKTAGTSLRVAAEQFFGVDRIVYDYGAHSPVTSACIRHYLYETSPPDWDGLNDFWRSQPPALIAGHKSVGRFAPTVGLSRSFGFVRDPLAQAFSNYLHLRRQRRFDGSFQEFFARRPEKQLKMFSNVPFQALGFVGVTEHYRASLRLLNALYDWRLTYKKVNRAGWLAPSVRTVSADDRAAFEDINRDEIALYQQIVWHFGQRLALHRQQKSFVHGDFEVAPDGQIKGWAWWAGNEASCPVALELWVNGAPMARRLSGDLNLSFQNQPLPREGQVGFEFDAPSAQDLRCNVRVVETGQWLKPPEIKERMA